VCKRWDTPDKFPRRQPHDLDAVAVVIVTPAECHLALVHGHQAMVADGYAMRIAAQVGPGVAKVKILDK